MAANREVVQRRAFAKGFTRNFSVFLDDDYTVNCRRTALLKIRPDLCEVFVTDSVHLFQIVSAAERPCGNNSSSHDWPNARNHSQFLFCRCVDVDFASLDVLFPMGLFTLAWTTARNRAVCCPCYTDRMRGISRGRPRRTYCPATKFLLLSVLLQLLELLKFFRST